MQDLKLLFQRDYYQNWQQVYEQVSSNKVNLIQSYNVMRIFLEQWAVLNLNKKLFNIYIEQFRVDAGQIPTNYSFFYNWIKESNKVLIGL